MHARPMMNRCATCGAEWWDSHVCPKQTLKDGRTLEGWLEDQPNKAGAFVAFRPQHLTARELELLKGWIERELHHAAQCDSILARPDGNHRMARAQKGWDMERVALLRKLVGLEA